MDIFVIKTDSVENISEELLHDFAHKKISNKKLLKTHCLSYLMVDRILKNFYGMDDTEIEFVEKKPYLKNRKKYFSISHSGEYIVLGFSNSDCGVDIERIKKRDYEKISDRMEFKSGNLKEFYYNWTKYEAEYKLAQKTGSFKTFQYEDYIITAVSFEEEKFELFVQNGNEFPKSDV